MGEAFFVALANPLLPFCAFPIGKWCKNGVEIRRLKSLPVFLYHQMRPHLKRGCHVSVSPLVEERKWLLVGRIVIRALSACFMPIICIMSVETYFHVAKLCDVFPSYFRRISTPSAAVVHAILEKL